jgi:hypothetical protein
VLEILAYSTKTWSSVKEESIKEVLGESINSHIVPPLQRVIEKNNVKETSLVEKTT